MVVDVADVSPSRMFNSAVVTVAPSIISSSASEIVAFPIVIDVVNVGVASGALALSWV